jgi:protein ImuB
MSPAASFKAAAHIRLILAILHKWGVHTVGQFAALDKEALAARLGPEAVRLWERANGKSQRILKLVRPPESFEESFEFDHEVETAEPLLFILRRFLEQLTLRLRAIYLVPKELALRITFANKTNYQRVFKIPQPTGDVDLLFRMLQTHLENFKSDHAIIAVALAAQPTKPPRQQFGLFEATLRNPHQLAETLARLTALVGPDRVGTPVLEDTHRPDAFRIEPFSWNAVEAAVLGGSNAPRIAHPTVALRRFRLPKSLPAKIANARGPYLLSGNWWDEKSWARAEWDAQLEDSTLCRSYQDENGTQIEGIYD